MSKEPVSRTILKNAHKNAAKLRRGLQDGLTIEQIANECRCAPHSVRLYLGVLGLEYKRDRKRTVPEKVQNYLTMRSNGCTLEEIGRAHGVTRERVRQSLQRYFPEIVLPAKTKAPKICTHCGSEHQTNIKGNFCTIRCRRANKNQFVFTRDVAEKIMRFRDAGMTWDEVAKEVNPRTTGMKLRASIQREMVFFSSKEQEAYFPKREEPNIEEEPKEKHQQSPLHLLRKFLRLT